MACCLDGAHYSMACLGSREFHDTSNKTIGTEKLSSWLACSLLLLFGNDNNYLTFGEMLSWLRLAKAPFI